MKKIRVTEEEFNERLKEQEELADSMKDETPAGETFSRSYEEAYGMYEILQEKHYYLNEAEEEVVKKCPFYIKGKNNFVN